MLQASAEAVRNACVD